MPIGARCPTARYWEESGVKLPECGKYLARLIGISERSLGFKVALGGEARDSENLASMPELQVAKFTDEKGFERPF
jgi:hypothetical protein